MMKERLLLVLNPYAGQRRANRFLPEIIRLFNDRGYECSVYVTSGVADATAHVRENGGKYDRIVCIGGDGTLNETIAGMIEGQLDLPVGYIPAGTTNDYARSLGITGNVLQAAKDAVDGECKTFDIGNFDGRYFNYTASCGAFAKASYSTPQYWKNMLGHVAYIIEGIKDLPSIKPIHMRLESDEQMLEGDFLFCSVTNTMSMGGILKFDPELISLNDGLFEVMMIKNPTTPAQLTKILMGLSSSELPNEMIHFFTAKDLVIETADEIEWTLDGERGSCGTHFEIHNMHKRIRLVLPTEAREAVSAEGTEYEAEDQLPD